MVNKKVIVYVLPIFLMLAFFLSFSKASACTNDNECGTGDVCAFYEGETDGICVNRTGTGTSTSNDCENKAHGDLCTNSSGRKGQCLEQVGCVVNLEGSTKGGNGSDCWNDYECSSDYCRFQTGEQRGTCFNSPGSTVSQPAALPSNIQTGTSESSGLPDTTPAGTARRASIIPYEVLNSGLADNSIKGILVNLLTWLLGIFGILAIMAFVISGIQYLLSYSSEELAEKAKKNMMNAIIGIVVALGSFVVLQAIQYALEGFGSF